MDASSDPEFFSEFSLRKAINSCFTSPQNRTEKNYKLTKLRDKKRASNEKVASSVGQKGRSKGTTVEKPFYVSIFDELNGLSLSEESNPLTDQDKADRARKKRDIRRNRRVERDKKFELVGKNGEERAGVSLPPDEEAISFMPDIGSFQCLRAPNFSGKSLVKVESDDTIQPAADDEIESNERVAFYRNFSALVRAGEKAMREQELQYAATFRSDAASSSRDYDDARRKTSSTTTKLSRRLTFPAATKSAAKPVALKSLFGDWLWLHLQAWKAGKSLKRDQIAQSLFEIDQDLVYRRLHYLHALEEINSFVFDYPRDASSNGSHEQDDMANEPNERNRPLINSVDDVTDLNEQFVNAQNLAIFQVDALLRRLDTFQSLFPDLKSYEEYVLEKYPIDLTAQINVIQVWYNLTRDLCRKMRHIGRMFDLQKVKAAEFYWPNLNYESPTSRSRSSSSSARISEIGTSPKSSNDVYSNSTSRAYRSSLSNLADEIGLNRNDAKNKSVYTAFVERSLKLRGMHLVLTRVLKCLVPTLCKVRLSLQKKRTKSRFFDQKFMNMEESALLAAYGQNNAIFKAINLPSYFRSYLFLLKVLVDLTHEWIKIRIAQKQDRTPDPITLDQLIQDCRDCLAAAVEVKCFYHENVQACVDGQKLIEKLLIDNMQDFETDLFRIFDIYLEYVRLWASHQTSLHQVSSEWSQSLIFRLEEEWNFAKKISMNILSGEADAARRFCHINSEMYASIEDLLEELKEALMCTFLKASQEEQLLSQDTVDDKEDDEREEDFVGSTGNSSGSKSSKVFKSCRLMRRYLHEIREKSLRALAFSKLLRRDLEIAVKFEIVGESDFFLDKLYETDHYLIKTVNVATDFYIFCQAAVAHDDEYLQMLLNVTCGRDQNPQIESSKGNGYLLLFGYSDCNSQTLWSKWLGNVKTIAPDADASLSLHNLEIDGVYLVAVNSLKLTNQTTALIDLLGPETIAISNEQCSCHGVLAEYMHDLKKCAMTLRSKIVEWLKAVEQDYAELQSTNPDKPLDLVEKQTYRDSLIQAYNFAFEYHRDLYKILTGPTKRELMERASRVCDQWTNFVRNLCERGHGSRPRWANEGLNFLAFVSDPLYTLSLSDDQFSAFKTMINNCIDHIIGSRRPSAAGNRRKKINNSYDAVISVPRAISWPQAKQFLAVESTAGKNITNYPRRLSAMQSPNEFKDSDGEGTCSDLDLTGSPLPNQFTVGYTYEKALQKLKNLDVERDEKLKVEKLIGRCVERQQMVAQKQIALKRANFAWQKMNNLIGAGKFGSVYTAIRLDTTELIAVKQIKFQRHDHQAMQSLVDEITNFESIRHENLVRYYGVEVHRDELFIFMEFCNEGTLERLCSEGLSEESVRIYTLHLLKAVCELHRRGIVHRDIKTANIFLSSDYTLKLGDFGSSVRLVNSTTNVGELTMHVGTPTYMAPEVCTSSQEGYGRMADIWSVGCVVLEMATGKPPWHDLPTTFAIIWRVGNGAIPNIPDNLSVDCRSFLLRCLKSKSCERSSAEQLLEHPFVKVTQTE